MPKHCFPTPVAAVLAQTAWQTYSPSTWHALATLVHLSAKSALLRMLLRHTLAMALLQASVDRAVIALWLGHE